MQSTCQIFSVVFRFKPVCLSVVICLSFSYHFPNMFNISVQYFGTRIILKILKFPFIF
jgi:hypothetical protein